jgi:hypothetical protein
MDEIILERDKRWVAGCLRNDITIEMLEAVLKKLGYENPTDLIIQVRKEIGWKEREPWDWLNPIFEIRYKQKIRERVAILLIKGWSKEQISEAYDDIDELDWMWILQRYGELKLGENREI